MSTPAFKQPRQIAIVVGASPLNAVYALQAFVNREYINAPEQAQAIFDALEAELFPGPTDAEKVDILEWARQRLLDAGLALDNPVVVAVGAEIDAIQQEPAAPEGGLGS